MLKLLISLILSLFLEIAVMIVIIVNKAPNAIRRTSVAALWHRGFTTRVELQSAGFTAWGDSLTAGYGASFLHDFPTIISLVYGRPIINEGVSREPSIWAGRNNAYLPEDVLADIRAMVADLNPRSRYLVLGLINADRPKEVRGGVDWAHIVYVNQALAEEYGDRFIAIREALLAAAAPGDRKNVDEDTVPRSLRSDDLHLNDEGQALVANAVEAALHARGW